jgi:hypothetical protein
MTNTIRTYDDLVRERQEAEILLLAQKELVMADLRLLQTQVKGASSTLSVFGKIFSRDRHNFFINYGLDKVIDFLVRKVVLAKAGWMTKMAASFLAKNLSSHVVEDKKEKFVDKLFNWISHKNGKGKRKESYL